MKAPKSQPLKPCSQPPLQSLQEVGPPMSLRSCGSNMYVSSYIDTKSQWPASHMSNYITDPRAYSNATIMAETFSQNQTVEEALASLERAAHSLRIRRYRQALRLYLDGGYALANVAENEQDTKIRNLLTSKAFEILNWCAKLCDWIEGRVPERFPRPGVHKVGIPVFWNAYWSGGRLDEEEGCRLWYTPVHCVDPIHFTALGYRLRCVEIQRRPKLMICITTFNEGPAALKATLHSIGKNLIYIKDFNKHNQEKLPVKGSNVEDFWKDVIICIMLDGRESANPKTIEYLASLGIYDEDIVTINSAGLDPHCHLFEHTLQIVVDGRSLPPLQTIFALKEQKTSKLGSHHWFFHSFAEQIQPEFTFLMDIGTKLDDSALHKILFAFEENPQVGGACGQLVVDEPYAEFSNWVVSAQHFEYKINNLLDRTLESCFGILTVLPGAFSAYRYEAIRGEPLDAYFRTLHVDLDVLGPFLANMHLAEDRVLSFEIVARRNCNWTLQFVRDAIARTDVPRNLIDLINQRKRWTNGSFFATLFMFSHTRRIFTESNHSVLRRCGFSIFFLYELLKTVGCFLLPATVYLALLFLVFQGFRDNEWKFLDTSGFSQSVLDGSVYLFNLMFAACLLMLVIISLGNSPKHVKLTYYLISSVFGAMMMLSSWVAVGNLLSQSGFQLHAMILSLLTAGVYYIGPAIHGDLHTILLTFSHYALLIPTFVYVLGIYGFSNLQDLSWGTKGLIAQRTPSYQEELNHSESNDFRDVVENRKVYQEQKREALARIKNQREQYEAFRTSVLIAWITWNVITALGVVRFVDSATYLKFFAMAVALLNSSRLVGSAAYLVYKYTGGYRAMFIRKERGNNATLSGEGMRGLYEEEINYTVMEPDLQSSIESFKP